MNLQNFIELIIALGTVAAAIAAAVSARHSSKAVKVGSNPILKIGIAPGDIGPDKFFAFVKNVGTGLARKIKVYIPAQNRWINTEVPNLQKDEQSPQFKIVEHENKFYEDPRIIIEYTNIFGDKIKTTGTVTIDRSRERPQVGLGVNWDVDF